MGSSWSSRAGTPRLPPQHLFCTQAAQLLTWWGADTRMQAGLARHVHPAVLRCRQPVGMYFSAFNQKGRFREILRNWPSHNVRLDGGCGRLCRSVRARRQPHRFSAALHLLLPASAKQQSSVEGHLQALAASCQQSAGDMLMACPAGANYCGHRWGPHSGPG